ncbi:MAG: 6-bladed beta-propeller [Bacteroidales bacterium]|nr:6-bladed beta-propeller [Bacteroidales bacterium]
MRKSHYLLVSLTTILCLIIVSCRQHLVVEDGTLSSTVVCKLGEELTLLNQIRDVSFLNDSTFIVLSDADIITYDISGRQKSVLNKRGRGPLEYTSSTMVAARENRLFVWSPFQMKFVVYDQDGQGLCEYPYPSALVDFIPMEDCMIIYCTGLRQEHIIDILDLSTGEISASLVEASTEHQILQSNASSGTMAVDGKMLYFASRDKLDVYRYDLDARQLEQIRSVESKTFRVDQQPDREIISTNFEQALQYLVTNSWTVCLAAKGDEISLLANEGSAVMKDRKIVEDHYITSLYTFSVDGDRVARSASDRFITAPLVTSFEGQFYVIRQRAKESEDYTTLERLVF